MEFANFNSNQVLWVMADIDMSQVDGFQMIGSDSGGFEASFQGFGHYISNLTIDRANDTQVGLFVRLEDPNGFGGSIENLMLENPDITGNYNVGAVVGENYGTVTDVAVIGGNSCSIVGSDQYTGTVIGGVVGYNGAAGSIQFSNSSCTVDAQGVAGGLVGWNDGSIENSFADGQTTVADQYGGGLVGSNRGGTISHSSSHGTVSSSNSDVLVYDLGGLVGINRNDNDQNTTGSIQYSFSDATVEGSSRIGGLVGTNEDNSEIQWCEAAGTVEADGAAAGGLVGTNQGIVDESFATTDVQSPDATAVGGLVGSFEAGQLSRSYARGDVTGSDDIGGLIGSFTVQDYETGQVNTCYSSGAIEATSENAQTVGGFLGYFLDESVFNDPFQANYWDTDTDQLDGDQAVGNGSSVEVSTGLTTGEFGDPSNFSSSWWVFGDGGSWEIGPDEDENSRPYLRWEDQL